MLKTPASLHLAYSNGRSLLLLAHGGTPISSLGNQPTSTRISAGRAHFGTSTRGSAMKMYALWSVGQQR